MRIPILVFRTMAAAMVLVCLSGCSPDSGGGDKMKVAGVFTTSLEDPRASVIYQGLKQSERELEVVCDVVEDVAPDKIARVLRDYAEKGYPVIFGDARDCEDIVRKVARDFPEIAFCFCSNLGPTEPNFSVFNSWVYEPAYLCGLLAGRLTKTNTVGAVAGRPDPVVNCLLNSFNQGVMESNPAARVLIISPGDTATMIKEVSRLVEAGADHIYAGFPGSIMLCQKKGVIAFGNLQDQYSLAADTVITGTVWDMWPTVEKVITDMEEERYQAMDLREWSMMAKGGAYLASYHSFEGKIPYDLKDEINQKRRDIMAGTLRVPANEFPLPAE